MKDNKQEQRVLNALKDRPDGLTTFDLMRFCNMTRPANAIMNLRRDGYNIADIWETSQNGTHYVRYQLVGDADD